VDERADRRKGLPSGTVTLLFADIEGSTRLLNALGVRFGSVRARSREIVREIASRHRGADVDWAGDGVFLAFQGARDGVAAAAELQRALDEEPWGPEEAIRLRIGLHTGEPDLDGDGYVGIDVVVAARICSAAHGGQVVVSETTRNLVGDAPLHDVTLRALGEHRLKDVLEPQPLYQLVGPGLTETFPPLSTFGGATLPALHHRLVGRDAQLEEIEALLARDDIRLVTVTGPGGTGKSRLALEVCARVALRRPVHLVGLASISDSSLVPAAIARVLGVRESPDRTLVHDVAEALAGKHTLLYLDNLEHLPGAAEHVRDLLDAVPDLDVLATSRAPLRLSRERVLPLEPLPVDEAVQLFVELSRDRGVPIDEAQQPVAREICVRLDCLPLAIELVAARMTFLSPAQLLEALDHGLAFELEGPSDLPARQRTLGAAIGWSFGLLTPGQQALHCVLAVFSGGCTLEDARHVAGDPDRLLGDLEALVLGSLVRGDAAAGGVRLSMLETVREDALARLTAAGRLDELRNRHADRFLELALEAEQGLAGPEQAAWTERVEPELDNIRSALDWLLLSGRVEDMLRATSALERFWRATAHVSEARRRFALGLDLADELVPEVRAAALRNSGHMAMSQSDWHAAATLFDEAIALFEECDQGTEVVVGLSLASFVELRRDDPERADALGRRALELARILDDERALVLALMALADVGWVRGEYERSLAQYEEAVEISRRTNDPLLVVNVTYNLGMAAYQGGDLDRGRGAFEEALRRAIDLGDAPHRAAARFMLAELDVLAGDTSSAREHAQDSLALYTELEDSRSRARCLVILAAAAAVDGRSEDAARLLGAAETARGDAAADEFEAPVLARVLPDLESTLGVARLAAIVAEGARDGENLPAGVLVTRGTRE